MSDMNDKNMKNTADEETLRPDKDAALSPDKDEKSLPAEDEKDRADNTDNTDKADKKKKKKNSSSSKKKPEVDKRNKTLKRSAWISVLLLIAIVIAVNVILNSIVGSKWQFDWTANKAATIGDVTKQILQENDKPVKITVLAERENYGKSGAGGDLSFLPNLLDQYVEEGGGHIEVNYENPVTNPAVITALDPQNVHQLRQNQIVVSNEDQSKMKVLRQKDLLQVQQYYVTGYVAEEVLTGAVRFVTSEFTPVVYLTGGHGEADADKHFTILKMLLEQNNYLVKNFDSVTADAVPDDAELLLMLSPQSDISAGEVDVYMNFLKKGGSLLAMVDYSTVDMPNLNTLLREFNLKLTTDKIQENDTQRAFSNDPSSFVADINDSKLYKKNQQMDYAVVFDSRAVTTAESGKDWIKTEPILSTGDQATRLIGGSKDNVSEQAVQYPAMFSENTGFIDGSDVTKSAKVAVFGSAYPFTDTVMLNYMNSSGNYLLANSALAYMSNLSEHSEGSLLIKPKQVVSYAIAPNNQSAVQILSVVFMAIVPLALLITAMVVYQKRKRL